MERDPARLALRHKAVDSYYRLGSLRRAAREVKKPISFVKRWVRRQQAGLAMYDLPRTGRNSSGLDSEKAILAILDAMVNGEGPAGMVLRLKSVGIIVNKETVRRFVKQNLGRPLRPVKKPRLTRKHLKDRLTFCLKWVRRSWQNVVVTDSKYFWLCPRGVGPKVWVPYGDTAPNTPAEKNCFKVHAYAGVSKWGRTKLIVTVGTTGLQASTKGVTGQVYKDLLEKELIPECKRLMERRPGLPAASRKNWVFQQDNARAHTCKLVTRWLREQDFQIMKWPAKSPDLSWIENMWGYVAKQLSQRCDLTEENFISELMKAWDSIPDTVHNNMYESIKNRLHACIDAQGGSTKY